MKIVLDMNIPIVWESFLSNAGHSTIHWSKIGNIGAQDSEIMEWARKNKHIVFTHDLDFGAMLYSTNALEPSVIQLRGEHILPKVFGKSVLEVLKTTEDKLKSGCLIVIDTRKHRTRVLPLRKY